jgi:hypothetical protein
MIKQKQKWIHHGIAEWAGSLYYHLVTVIRSGCLDITTAPHNIHLSMVNIRPVFPCGWGFRIGPAGVQAPVPESPPISGLNGSNHFQFGE